MMLESRVIKYSNSPYSNPIVIVKKNDDSSRLCIDYKSFNKSTIKNKYPIPIVEELFD